MGRSCEDRVILRARIAQDDPELLELFNEERFLHDASVREPFASCEEMQIWLDGVVAAQRCEIVATTKTKVVGFGGLYIMGEGQSHLGWLMLGVREAFQGRGVGSLLLHSLVAIAQVLAGLQRLQLTVFSDNEAALALYKKFGFAIEGRHRRFAQRGADFVDAFTMALLFEEGTAAEPDAEMLRSFACTSWGKDSGGRAAAA